MVERYIVAEESRPCLPRHVKLRHDKTRDAWILLAPERVLVPDETAIEIVRSCDGVKTIAVIVDDLAKRYTADREIIGTDVKAMLQDLADKGFLINGAD
ncbi:MAG: pyrroloquinoline quinone biosynthesis peptide chaperone PqqD [Alphaproteobacteria bacterium]|nr:pyrroloquinoline quinone biosynthesis peptide chaperone PqqD [Alphaproteobacteria bacterium]